VNWTKHLPVQNFPCCKAQKDPLAPGNLLMTPPWGGVPHCFRTGTRNLFPTTGRINYGMPLAGRKIIQFCLTILLFSVVKAWEISFNLLSMCLLVTEFRFDAMLCSNLGAANSDADHNKCSRGHRLPPSALERGWMWKWWRSHMWLIACVILLFRCRFILCKTITLFFEEFNKNFLQTVPHAGKTESNSMRLSPNFW